MARRPKSGLDYFPINCDIFTKQSDLRPLLRQFKADGLAVYVHILCDVYSNGYYFQTNDLEGYLMDIAEDVGCSLGKVQLIVAFMQERTLLRAFTLDKNTVLTSHGIQKRYVEATKRRVNSGYAGIRDDICLLSKEELNVPLDNADRNTDSCNRNNDFCNRNADKNSENAINKIRLNNRTPLPPYEGEAQDEGAKEKFLQTYPKLRATNIDDSNIDYSLLLTEFSKSMWLKGSYSMKWVAQNYEAIISGAYRDKVKVAEVDEKGERESWYSKRKDEEERGARAFLDKARCDKDFADSERELRKLDIAEAKAEVSGDEAELKQLMLKRSENETRRKMALERLHIREADLLPKYHCAKCSDTGYFPNGIPCDCYKEKR